MSSTGIEYIVPSLLMLCSVFVISIEQLWLPKKQLLRYRHFLVLIVHPGQCFKDYATRIATEITEAHKGQLLQIHSYYFLHFSLPLYSTIASDIRIPCNMKG